MSGVWMFNLCNIFQFVILNASDYTVSDEDIIKFIWKGETSIQINTFLFCRKRN